MKTILAPVDFSEASINALAFAAELARRASARLLIINILQEEEEEEEAKNKLKKLAWDLKKSVDADLKCESFVAHGSLIAALKKVIAAQHPNLVVMGTKGASGLKRILIGSNTVNVIAKTDVPVLVIPEVARFENFLKQGKTRFVVATDLDLWENENSLDILKKMALSLIEPKVIILNVRPKNTVLSPLKRLDRQFLLSIFDHETECETVTVFSNNVIRGINYYVSQHEDTGLIGMFANDSGRLLQKHYTREMASHTHLPLLVLRDVKV